MSNQTKSYSTRDDCFEARIAASLGGYGIRVANAAVGYAKFFSRSHDALIRVFDEAGKRD